MAAAAAALPAQAKAEPVKVEAQAKPEPAPLTSGVIQSQPLAIIPGSAEPMKPVKVKTVQVKAGGAMKLASAGPAQPAPPVANAVPPARAEIAETSNAVVAKADMKADVQAGARPHRDRPPDGCSRRTAAPAGRPWHRQWRARRAARLWRGPRRHAGDGLCRPGEEPAAASRKPCSRMAPSSRWHPAVTRSGWIIQVGALETEGEARQRIEAAKNQARGMLAKADSFTEPVVAKDNRKLFRARFAGLERDQAEAVCRALKRADISCITVRN